MPAPYPADTRFPLEIGRIPPMQSQPPPTTEQLAKELGKFVKNGLGRDLPGAQNERTVKALSDLCRELAANPSEEWTTRIARVVIKEVKLLKPEVPDRLAVADVLAIGDPARDAEEIIADIEAGEVADGLEARHQQAANRYTRITARTFAEDYRPQLLERVCERLRGELEAQSEAVEEGGDLVSRESEHDPPQEGTDGAEDRRQAEPPILLVGAVGVLLLSIGVVWLIATAAGAIG
jgi:hypothetical protein